MRFDTSQSMRLGQQMKLAPRVIQSMEILQMPLAELEERIEQELESNATLELVEGDGDPQALARDRAERDREERADERELDTGDAVDDFERLDRFAESNPEAAENDFDSAPAPAAEDREPERPMDQWDPRLEHGSGSRSRLAGERDPKTDAMASAAARDASPAEQLLDQWRLVDVDEALRAPGELILGFLDDDGLLRTPLEEILDHATPAVREPLGDREHALEELERALTAVQLFLEPAGIGARSARECLLLQLDALEDDETWDDADDKDGLLHLARTIVEDHLDDLMQNRLPKIAETTGEPIDRIKQSLGVLRRLSLAPGRRLATDRPAPITPDAIVEYDDDHDRYIAYLNESRTPNLQINREYALMSKDRRVEKRDRDFIKTNLSNAQWLIDAVDQRRKTLLRVINVVLDAQRDFFDEGPQSVRPLPMTQVAEQLGIHVATVSRAVSDKHLMTPRGVVPLRRFFTGGTVTDEGEEVSWDAIKAALQEVVDEEDKSKPLSDDKLAAALKDRGIEIARRTIAKYRAQLGIQSARLRKEF